MPSSDIYSVFNLFRTFYSERVLWHITTIYISTYENTTFGSGRLNIGKFNLDPNIF
jgi:hypothetical protein